MTISLAIDPKKKLLYIVAFFVALYLMMEISGLRTHIAPEAIKEIFLRHTVLGLFFFCLAYSVGNLVYVPGWIFLVGAVLALGKEWGGMASFLAALCSASISFFLIRSVGGTALRSLNNKWGDRIFSHLDQRPILSVALLRLLFQTLPAINYALALTDLRFRHYMIGTLIGLPLPIFLYCYFFETIFQYILN